MKIEINNDTGTTNVIKKLGFNIEGGKSGEQVWDEFTDILLSHGDGKGNFTDALVEIFDKFSTQEIALIMAQLIHHVLME